MKKTAKKLALAKETLRHLNVLALGKAQGGNMDTTRFCPHNNSDQEDCETRTCLSGCVCTG
jgi:hypothetical protein